MPFAAQSFPPPSCSGWCDSCQTEHLLEEGQAHTDALELMENLQRQKRIDFLKGPAEADPDLTTDYLFGKARGQMFGVLRCKNQKGELFVLKAFSGQFNGVWEVAGWLPPLFSVAAFQQIMIPADQRIKQLGREIAAAAADSKYQGELIKERKNLSQVAMKELHGLYMLHNFRGEKRALTDFYPNVRGIPTGAGDCCAPKLLNYAARNQLRPLGLSEFFWGKANRSGLCQPRRFYASCADKCQPILGFMLCGASS